MKLARTHPAERVEAAYRRALAIRTLTYRSVKSILAACLDQMPLQAELSLRLPQDHRHLRGAAYYRPTGLDPVVDMPRPGGRLHRNTHLAP